MKHCVVTVEVMTADRDLVRVFEKNIDHTVAKGRIETAARDSRAIDDVGDACEGDVALTVWNDVYDDDAYLVVYFPGDIACKAVARHFQFDAGVLQRATTPEEVGCISQAQDRYYAKAMKALGLQNPDDDLS